MNSFLSGNFFCVVDKGKVRATNEDFADAVINAYGQVMLVVADGMGGTNKGDYAAKYIGTNLTKDFVDASKRFTKVSQVSKWLYKTINKYNRDLYKKREEEAYKGMGSTLSVAILFANKVLTAQVGDSRVYWLNNETRQMEQLTKDQTYVQHLVSTKKIDEFEALTHPDRHKLTNAIGVRYNVLVDINTFDYHSETILVCSDGLYNNVPVYDMASILKGQDTPERKCYQLIAFGNSNGGSDNMAAIVWECD